MSRHWRPAQMAGQMPNAERRGALDLWATSRFGVVYWLQPRASCRASRRHLLLSARTRWRRAWSVQPGGSIRCTQRQCRQTLDRHSLRWRQHTLARAHEACTPDHLARRPRLGRVGTAVGRPVGLGCSRWKAPPSRSPPAVRGCGEVLQLSLSDRRSGEQSGKCRVGKMWTDMTVRPIEGGHVRRL